MLYARRFSLAALVLAVWSAVLLLAPGTAEACPRAERVAAAANGVVLHQAQPIAAAAATLCTAEAKATAVQTQICHAPAQTHGEGGADGCCVACSSAILVQMTSGIGVQWTASRQVLPRPDGADLADPGPGLRPPA